MRIANVNNKSNMGKIFMDKFTDFETYYKQLENNKSQIEAQIDFYWDYIMKNVDSQIEYALNDVEEFKNLQSQVNWRTDNKFKTPSFNRKQNDLLNQ